MTSPTTTTTTTSKKRKSPSRRGAAKIYKRRHLDENVYDAALARADLIFRRYDNVNVSFSGGKDSTAVLNVMLEAAKRRHPDRLPLDVTFYDEEAIPLQTEQYMRRVAEREPIRLRWLCVPIRHRNGCSTRSPWWFPWDPDCPELWVREMPPEAAREDSLPGWPADPMRRPLGSGMHTYIHPVGEGVVASVVGIRAEESMMRFRSVLAHRFDNWISRSRAAKSEHVFIAKPVYDWKVADIWLAARLFGWDHNAIYDLYDKIGVPARSQRVSPPFGEEPLGSLWQFAQACPEIWPKMARRVPGAATAAMYAGTHLYGLKDALNKPPDVEWPDFIAYHARRWPPAERKKVQQQVKRFVRQHFAKTSDPILARSPHPATGISWEFLAKLAIRGDLKERRRPIFQLKGTPAYAKQKAEYAKELAESRQQLE